jgi:hypothetical protein
VIYVCTAKGGAAMNILKELYYGNIVPTEKCAKLNSEVTELLKLLNRNEEKLTATLTEEQKENFEKYKDCNREIFEICEREAFLNGFRLGARIIIESVNQ